jgi:hypothetical protein
MDPLLMIFFASRTVLGDCRVPQSSGKAHHRGVSNWQLQRVARPGQPADNEPWPDYTPRGQVWITRLGSHTRVILLAGETEAEAAPRISSQSWA